jgi:hypothetical protein
LVRHFFVDGAFVVFVTICRIGKRLRRGDESGIQANDNLFGIGIKHLNSSFLIKSYVTACKRQKRLQKRYKRQKTANLFPKNAKKKKNPSKKNAKTPNVTHAHTPHAHARTRTHTQYKTLTLKSEITGEKDISSNILNAILSDTYFHS